jgi:hypothetical protein
MSDIKIIGKIGQFTTTKTEDVEYVYNLFWHVNNAMGDVTNFKWDSNYKMKNRIKNFNVGIWPQWKLTDVKNNNNYLNISKETSFYKNNLSLSGGIVLADKLIGICNNYAKKIGATFNPYLLIPDNSLNCSKVGDIVLAVNQVMDLLNKQIKNYNTNNNENVKMCSGILIEQEAKYQQSGNHVINATNIFAALRSNWSNFDINTPIAWSEQGPMPNIFAYDSKDDPINDIFSQTEKTILPPDYTWPDAYEGNNFATKFGFWNQLLLKSCPNGINNGGCPPNIDAIYGMKQENKECDYCAGYAKGLAIPTIGRYVIPAKNWGKLWKKFTTPISKEDQKQAIYIAGGPGADFAIINSGYDITDCSNCPINSQSINTLSEIVEGFYSKNNSKNSINLDNFSIALYG